MIHFVNVVAFLQSQFVIKLSSLSFYISGCVNILSKIAITKKQTLKESERLKLLNTVPFESSFHFYTELGKYTRITASSTVEFAEKLQTIHMCSVTFHFQRQDFQKWFKNIMAMKN